MESSRNVTIVIPVYSDWDSLHVCIESLIRYVAPNHEILLVNDMGPEWEELEQNILSSIDDHSNFRYEKNPENFGFVKTCNRAVFELDKTGNDILLLNSDTEVTEGFLEEMQAVLYAAEKHGAVCPRSCQSDILTIPVHDELQRNFTPKESYDTWLNVKDFLPRQQVIPTGVGFAILIKRSIINQYGLFDEIYSPGYNEENDFCQRINQYGFNIMMANRAYVYHFESKSFGERRNKLDEDHRDILKSRYPYYSEGVRYYFEREINPVDYFSDMMMPTGEGGLYEKPRILISLYEMPAAYNGTAQHGLSFLKAFYGLFHDRYDISILVNGSANELFKISEKYENVFLPYQLTGRFHIAYVPSQIIRIEHLHILNRTALKYVFCMQDIISVRSRYLLQDNFEREDVFRKSIRFCDGILPFSDFSMNDTRDYFSGEFERRNIYTKTVYLANTVEAGDAGQEKSEENNKALPFEEFFMVLGNQYKHKYLDVLLPYLKTLPYNFIVVGGKKTEKTSENVYEYKSGQISNELMNRLMRICTALIFPSVYEGFGLPIINAIQYRKKIVINNNELNREQIEALPYYRKNIYCFDKVQDIDEILRDIKSKPDPLIDGEIVLRTWEDEASEVEVALSEVMAAPIDVRLLNDRWNEFKYEERIHRCYVNGKVDLRTGAEGFIKSKTGVKMAIFARTHFPKLYETAKRIVKR